MNLQKRLDRLEQARRARHDADRGKLLERLLPQLTTAELKAMIDPRMAALPFTELEAIARGDVAPSWDVAPIPAAGLDRLRGLCASEYERGLCDD